MREWFFLIAPSSETEIKGCNKIRQNIGQKSMKRQAIPWKSHTTSTREKAGYNNDKWFVCTINKKEKCKKELTIKLYTANAREKYRV